MPEIAGSFAHRPYANFHTERPTLAGLFANFPDGRERKTEGSVMSRLKGKVAVVSGGNSGIGLAIAQRFVAEGAYVFIFGRRRQELDKAVTLIGSNVTAIQADASNLKDLDRVADVVRSAKGKVDVVVSNAGFTEKVPLREITEEHYDRTFNLMAKGPLFLVQKMLPMMSGGGSIILVASAMHYMGLANHSTYAAAKAALRSYVRTWAAEFKDSGIRANLLSPGPVDTPIMDTQAATAEEAAEVRKMYANYVPMLRLGRPEEQAAAAVFLASDESTFMTGSDMLVDGGVSNV
jgi:NAD(P)-dependent dehydrogenase (short-subunit alcohol dehydrogenase family)